MKNAGVITKAQQRYVEAQLEIQAREKRRREVLGEKVKAKRPQTHFQGDDEANEGTARHAPANEAASGEDRERNINTPTSPLLERISFIGSALHGELGARHVHLVTRAHLRHLGVLGHQLLADVTQQLSGSLVKEGDLSVVHFDDIEGSVNLVSERKVENRSTVAAVHHSSDADTR